MNILSATINTFDVRQEGGRLILLYNGRGICSLPWRPALEIARAIYIQAKKAEEWENAEKIVRDQAILTRLGAPIGLTNHPALLKEATKEAAWNTDLRRYIPPGRAGGIESQAVVGTPVIIKHKPKGDIRNG